MAEGEKDTVALVDSQGVLLDRTQERLPDDEVKILVAYERWMLKRGFRREAIGCNCCYDLNLMDGSRFLVSPTTGAIYIECRHHVWTHPGGPSVTV